MKDIHLPDSFLSLVTPETGLHACLCPCYDITSTGNEGGWLVTLLTWQQQFVGLRDEKNAQQCSALGDKLPVEPNAIMSLKKEVYFHPARWREKEKRYRADIPD